MAKKDPKTPGIAPEVQFGETQDMPAAPDRMIELAQRLQDRLQAHLSEPRDRASRGQSGKPPRLH